MALMTSMRNRMHFVLWALLILFLLSMTVGGLVGGANIIDELFGRVNPAEAIGVVNGERITPEDFARAVNSRVQQYRDAGQDPDDRLFHQIRNEVWNNYIQDILIYQTIDEMDLMVSEEEVVYHLQNNPPPFLQQDPSFQTEGIFDRSKYDQAINNPQGNEWVQIEQFMKQTYIPNFKLQQFIASEIVVTHDEVFEDYIKENIQYTIEGIHVIGRKLNENISEPSIDELQLAFNERKEEFKREETRKIRFVKWEKNPAKRDSNRVIDEATEIMNKIKKGDDFAKLANLYSEDPGNQITPDSGRGGDLGWFGKGQMVPPFEEAAFASNQGDIIGPVLSRFGYHIIKIHEKRTKNEKDEIHASHILLKISIGSETRDVLRRKASRFGYDAQDFGFDAAIDTHKISPISAGNLTALSISVPGLGFLREAVRFSFNSDIGDVSDRLENDQYYAIAVLDSIIEPSTQLLEEVKSNITRQLMNQKQMESALILANEIKSTLDDGSTFIDITSEDDRLELVPSDSKSLSRGFNSIGKSHTIIGALMNSKPGDIVGPLKTARGYAIIKLVNTTPIDSSDFQIKENQIYTKLTNQAQQNAFSDWLDELKSDAEIIDNRYLHY